MIRKVPMELLYRSYVSLVPVAIILQTSVDTLPRIIFYYKLVVYLTLIQDID